MIYGEDISAKNPEPAQNDRQISDHEMDILYDQAQIIAQAYMQPLKDLFA